MNRLLRFNAAVWFIVGIAVIWLLAGPPLMDRWAALKWKNIPCQISADKSGFSFSANGGRYASSRFNFWQTNNTMKLAFDNGSGQSNATCWVSPADPLRAVQRLDATTDWSNSGGRVVPAIALLVAAALITLFSSPKRKGGEPA